MKNGLKSLGTEPSEKKLNKNGVDARMTGKKSFIFHYQGSSL